ncbi:MAG: hypothetical protein LBT32_07815 [Peptococcaceae bacterium]|jgi:hypothetical protein|nr:hypothetical protein [Peptococcaceae bacterium]
MKKKLTAILLSSLLILMTIPATVFAEPVQDILDQDTYIQQKTAELLDEGMSEADASYYAQVDYMVKDMEQRGEVFTADPTLPELTDEDVSRDINAYRQKILNGDNAAITHALKSTARILSEGTERLSELIKNSPNQSQYQIIYPDGSTISFSPSKILPISDDDLIYPSAEYLMDSSTLPNSGNYTCLDAYWRFQAGISYAEVGLKRTDHTLNKTTFSTSIIYALGDASHAGIVSASSPTTMTSRSTNNNSTNMPAEAYCYSYMSVSGAFSATFGTLSVSGNVGLGWTQYIFVRSWGDGVVGHYASK